MTKPFEIKVNKTKKGYQVSFSIDHQTFFLQEQLPEHLNEEDIEKIGVKAYSEWYAKQLDSALSRLFLKGKKTIN